MTRKHFIAIAAALKANREAANDKDVADSASRAIADVCAQSNPQFSRIRFLRACGI